MKTLDIKQTFPKPIDMINVLLLLIYRRRLLNLMERSAIKCSDGKYNNIYFENQKRRLNICKAIEKALDEFQNYMNLLDL